MNEDIQYPLVSAICLAGECSPDDLNRTIRGFTAQTYPYKELIIVNNADSQLAASSLNIQAVPNVFMIDTPVKLTAGMAKNFGISSSNGQIITYYDANYYHSPDRLLKQAIALFENNAQICMLNSTLRYSFITGSASYNTNEHGGIFNSMMFIRPQDIDHDNINKLEEKSLCNKLIEKGYQAIALPLPHLMIKLIGSGNKVAVSLSHGLKPNDLEIINNITL